MKKIIFALTLMSLNAFASPSGRSYFYCSKTASYQHGDVYLMKVASSVVNSEGYVLQYFIWKLDGEVYDQGSYETSLKTPMFSDTARLHVRLIPGDHYFNCKPIKTLPPKIQKLADEVGPNSRG
jgi:hypothetical protein